MIESLFLDERRLLHGPWQAFERDVARLMLHSGFDDVRIVGGSGDKGGDILAAKNGQTWVVQCKHTTTGPPPREAVQEVVSAAQFYKAQRMLIATSRPPGGAFEDERLRFSDKGLKTEVLNPRELLHYVSVAPEYVPARRKLHDYQELASQRFREGLLDTGRAQIVMATGLGKTIVMAELVSDLLRDNLLPNRRVLVLAHTRDLVNQLHRGFWYQLPKWIATHQLADGEIPAFWDGITFATVQSVQSRLRELPEFDLVLVDEAHHVGADSFVRALEALSPKFIGGVTATPWRGDSYDIDTVLGAPVFNMGIAEGLSKGFLSDVDYRLLADNLDWEYVAEASKNHYSLGQLNRRLIIPTRDEEAVRIIKEVFEKERRRGGIVFSASIAHASDFAAMLRKYGFRAEPMSSAIEPRERESLLTRFRAGEIDIITTVDLFNEGMDVPDVDMVIFMRVTHSRRIFVQQLGRGLRTSPGKNKVVVLDFVTDLRRIAEVVELDRAVRADSVERLGLGGRLLSFDNRSAGGFLKEWMLDQASLALREGDPKLEVPRFEFPDTPQGGNVQ